MVIEDVVVLHHLPRSPNFNTLYGTDKDILKPKPGLNYLYRVNCGGPDYIDVSGNKFECTCFMYAMNNVSYKSSIVNGIECANFDNKSLFDIQVY